MKKYIVIFMLLLAVPASAETYFSGFAGTGINPDMGQEISGVDIGDVSTDLGFSAGGAIGHRFGDWRVEGELAYRYNGVDSLSGVSVGGDITASSFMVNGLYDFKTQSKFTPYVGLGVGVARVSGNLEFGGVTVVDDSSTGVAFQGIVGTSYRLSEKLDLTVDYRYMAAPSVSLDAAGLPVDSNYSNHSVNLGVRF